MRRIQETVAPMYQKRSNARNGRVTYLNDVGHFSTAALEWPTVLLVELIQPARLDKVQGYTITSIDSEDHPGFLVQSVLLLR